MLERRLELMRGAIGIRGVAAGGPGSPLARKRPPCIACEQGASGGRDGAGAARRTVPRPRLGGRSSADAPFCVDDLLALWAVAGDDAGFEPVARRQLARLEDLRVRLEGFVDHSRTTGATS